MSTNAARSRGWWPRPFHPSPIRIIPWINAFAIIVTNMSGGKLHDDDAIIRGLLFPGWLRLGDCAASRLNYHFAAMWLLVLNGFVYLTYFAAAERFRERLLPTRLREHVGTVRETLHFRIERQQLMTCNPVEKTLYGVVIAACVDPDLITGRMKRLYSDSRGM